MRDDHERLLCSRFEKTFGRCGASVLYLGDGLDELRAVGRVLDHAFELAIPPEIHDGLAFPCIRKPHFVEAGLNEDRKPAWRRDRLGGLPSSRLRARINGVDRDVCQRFRNALCLHTSTRVDVEIDAPHETAVLVPIRDTVADKNEAFHGSKSEKALVAFIASEPQRPTPVNVHDENILLLPLLSAAVNDGRGHR